MRPSSHTRAFSRGPRSSIALILATWLGALLPARTAWAEVVPVTTGAELEAAIDAAQAGDELVLADGTYAIGSPSCAAAGTAASPIVVRAEDPLGARNEVYGLEGFRGSGA
ncbi:MAG: chondroitinase-B domain-containing protein, partial [Polyangiaceae bacterium]